MTNLPTSESPGGSDEEETQKSPPHVRSVRSEELLQGARELRILHGTEVYRLMVTRNNKLILQK